MRVSALDHVNIVTEDLPGTARFYADLLDLDVRNGPPPSTPDKVLWVYDDADRPIVHLNAVGSFTPLDRKPQPGPDTRALHHVAFRCEGHSEVLARLDGAGLAYALNDVASINLKQIFVTDPNGVLLELNFFAG